MKVSPELANIEPAELSRALRGATPPRLIDVRSPAEYAAVHVAGAQLIPLDELEARIEDIPAGLTHCVMCHTGVRAATAAQVLARHGRIARVLTGGLLGWRRAGLPVVEAPVPVPIDRQVQLFVGTGVCASVLLGTLVHPAFLCIAAFLGAGLAFTGATGCAAGAKGAGDRS